MQTIPTWAAEVLTQIDLTDDDQLAVRLGDETRERKVHVVAHVAYLIEADDAVLAEGLVSRPVRLKAGENVGVQRLVSLTFVDPLFAGDDDLAVRLDRDGGGALGDAKSPATRAATLANSRLSRRESNCMPTYPRRAPYRTAGPLRPPVWQWRGAPRSLKPTLPRTNCRSTSPPSLHAVRKPG